MDQPRQSKSLAGIVATPTRPPQKPKIDAYLSHIEVGSGASRSKLLRPSMAPALNNLANYQTLITRAVDVFGDDKRASLWLSTPSLELGGQIPLKVAEEDDYSLEQLEPIFIRIEHGIDF